MAEKDTFGICTKFFRTHPEINAIMLECNGIQPFARAIQQVIDMPVFSCGIFMD
jgi:hypothetical protein